MTSLQLEIVTHEKRLVYDLIGKDIKTDESIEISPGVSLTYKTTLGFKGLGEPQIIGLVLTVAKEVPASVVGAWLWSKLQGRTTSLRIDRTQVELQEEKITRIIYEKIEKN